MVVTEKYSLNRLCNYHVTYNLKKIQALTLIFKKLKKIHQYLRSHDKHTQVGCIYVHCIMIPQQSTLVFILAQNIILFFLNPTTDADTDISNFDLYHAGFDIDKEELVSIDNCHLIYNHLTDQRIIIIAGATYYRYNNKYERKTAQFRNIIFYNFDLNEIMFVWSNVFSTNVQCSSILLYEPSSAKSTLMRKYVCKEVKKSIEHYLLRNFRNINLSYVILDTILSYLFETELDIHMHVINYKTYYSFNLDLLFLYLCQNDAYGSTTKTNNIEATLQLLSPINKPLLWQNHSDKRDHCARWPLPGYSQSQSIIEAKFAMAEELCIVYDISFEMALYFMIRSACNHYELHYMFIKQEFSWDEDFEDDETRYNDYRRTLRLLKNRCYPNTSINIGIDDWNDRIKLTSKHLQLLKKCAMQGDVKCDEFGYIESMNNDCQQIQEIYQTLAFQRLELLKLSDNGRTVGVNENNSLCLQYDQIDWKNGFIIKTDRNWVSNKTRGSMRLRTMAE